MQPGPAEPASHIRHGTGTVESRQYAEAIDQEQRRRPPGRTDASWLWQIQRPGTPFHPTQVIAGRLVRNQNESGSRVSAKQQGERGKHDPLIGGPGGSRDQGRRATSESKQWLVQWDGGDPLG